jgi:hypothetical protein
MTKAKIFSTFLNGTATQVKAYTKKAAVEWFQNQRGGEGIKAANVKWLKNAANSHQTPIEEQV